MSDEDMAHSRKSAADALRRNKEGVSKFAMRGAASAGVKAAVRYRRYAPLSDPDLRVSTGAQNEDTFEALLAALDVIIHALETNGAQESDETFDVDVHVTALDAMAGVRALCETTGVAPKDIVASLEYLRDRIGVPRDMHFAAARQARAHVNWAIDGMLP